LDRDVVGAELLIRTTEDGCDVTRAWRVLNSSSFSPAWLLQASSRGLTPVMAAVVNGCAEVAAAIMLHPEFDFKTVRKTKFRNELARVAKAKKTSVRWAYVVVTSIIGGRNAELEVEWDPTSRAYQTEWYLPQPGEWFAPLTLEGIGLPQPAWPKCNISGLIVAYDQVSDSVYGNDGTVAQLHVVRQLWFLLVMMIQEDNASATYGAAKRNIRSLGWHLFFSGGNKYMAAHAHFITMVSMNIHDTPAEGAASEELRAKGLDHPSAYEHLGLEIALMWNRTGDWVVANKTDHA